MKKFLLLSFLIASAFNSFAFVTQGHWRWRKDDGSETTATWLAAEDATPTITSSSDKMRIRFELFNTQTTGSDVGTTVLTYSADGGTTWETIKTTAGTRAFVLAGTSTFVTDGLATTKQLTGTSGYSFQPGKVIVSTSSLAPDVVAKGAKDEYEWVIKPTANIKVNTTYLFKPDTNPGDGSYNGTVPPASLTTASVLPITLANFAVQQDKNRVIIQWSTATELNSDHFEIERSTDGNKWEKIATVKAAGNSNQARSYKVYDENAANGTSYYRIRQYDFDGSYHFSEVRSLKMMLENMAFTVFPNPAKSAINLMIKNYAGSQVTATLSTIGGKRVHQEIISVDKSATNYKLNMKTQPAPGTYILLLKGDNFSQSIKVLVQ